ncbi:MAG: hypothetical protein GQ523_08035 [Methanophagales archaeon]|nr:hypothetical protein [Methanophagales archaeon]
MNSKDSGMGEGKGGDVVVETVARLMVPFIQLFGLYVIIHGAGGPGGGFQGGVIIASSFILYVIAFGIVKAGNRFSEAKKYHAVQYWRVSLRWCRIAMYNLRSCFFCAVSQLWFHTINTPF